MRSKCTLVSVVTVCRNSADSIGLTINSVLKQKHPLIEFIVIDGLSSDNTFKIAKSYQNQFEAKGFKFICISEHDRGIYDAMNKGVKMATGEWIVFMNSGDVFHDSFVIDHIFNVSNKLDSGIIYGNTLTLNSNKVAVPPQSITKNFFIAETICHQSLFCRRDVFENVGFFDLKYRIIADREWLLKAFLAKVGFQYVPIVVSIWDEEGFSKQNIQIYIEESKELKLKYYTVLERIIYSIKWKIRSFIK